MLGKRKKWETGTGSWEILNRFDLAHFGAGIEQIKEFDFLFSLMYSRVRVECI